MKRVLILGRGASGKSTLAKLLGEITELPVIELDKGLLAARSCRNTSPSVVGRARAACRERWMDLDGDLGSYDAVEVRLSSGGHDHSFGLLTRPLRLASSPAIARACRRLALALFVALSKPSDSHAGDR